MDKNEVLNKMRELLADIKPSPQLAKLDGSTTFFSLGLDEFDFIEMVMLLEEAYNLVIEDQQFALDSTIDSLFLHMAEQEAKLKQLATDLGATKS